MVRLRALFSLRVLVVLLRALSSRQVLMVQLRAFSSRQVLMVQIQALSSRQVLMVQIQALSSRQVLTVRIQALSSLRVLTVRIQALSSRQVLTVRIQALSSRQVLMVQILALSSRQVLTVRHHAFWLPGPRVSLMSAEQLPALLPPVPTARVRALALLLPALPAYALAMAPPVWTEQAQAPARARQELTARGRIPALLSAPLVLRARHFAQTPQQRIQAHSYKRP
ncbi:MAG: hypothetical protein FWB94_08775 [Chitinispirillia bacterium]|nr:hypothetical protein [Chitinispirillia bacterium]